MGTASSGQKVLPDVVDEIADGMIATGLWWNADSTWNTSVRTGNLARRVMAYGAAGGAGKGDTTLSAGASSGATVLSVASESNFSVGDTIVIGTGATAEVRKVQAVAAGQLTVTMGINTARSISDPVKELAFETFLALEVINSQIRVQPSYNNPLGWGYLDSKGLIVTFASQWNWNEHYYMAGAQSSFINFNGHTNGMNADMAVMKITYWYWYEALGFCMIGTPDATGDSYQQAFFCCVERNPDKEFSDGLSNWYCYNVMNGQNVHNTDVATNYRVHNLMRPFAFMTPEDTWRSSNYNSTVLAGMNAGITFPYRGANLAFRSTGNNKVYFHKPQIQSNRGFQQPIFQSELFWAWNEGAGLVDGDVVMPTGGTRSYLLKAVSSPDVGTKLCFALKYTD
jgi:hypothetical protein